MRTRMLALALLAAPAALAEEPAAPAPPVHGYTGTFSHGDSSGFVEELYGDRVERPAAEAPSATRKYDPAIRWDDRPIRR